MVIGVPVVLIHHRDNALVLIQDAILFGIIQLAVHNLLGLMADLVGQVKVLLALNANQLVRLSNTIDDGLHYDFANSIPTGLIQEEIAPTASGALQFITGTSFQRFKRNTILYKKFEALCWNQLT